MDKKALLKNLNEKWILECTCGLKNEATQGVCGEGSHSATVVFIGEAPGKKEDESGRPFVGSAGKFLDEMLASINLKREEVYITNIVKYRPPNNRDPLPKEIADCAEWLTEEIKIIDPTLIVLLGRHAMHQFFPDAKISEAHGVLVTSNYFGKTRNFLPLYHPAAALYNGALREVLKEDFKRIPLMVKNLKRGKACL